MPRPAPALSHAVKSLLKARSVSLLVIAILALTIGCNVAIYSVFQAVVLKPYPLPEPERLVTVWTESPRRGVERSDLAPSELVLLRKSVSTLGPLAAFDADGFDVTRAGETERVEGGRVTAEFFPVLGLAPLLGRGFSPEEDRPGAAPVAILSEGLWRGWYNADAGVLGRSLWIDGKPHAIVGVMPTAADVPEGARLWVPLALDLSSATGARSYLTGMARLAPGISARRAQTELATIGSILAQESPSVYGDRGFRLVSLRELRVGNLRPVLAILLGMVLFVLLIGCANIATLLLARDQTRRKEIAIRATLGASTRQILGQAVLESLLLSFVGGALGTLLGAVGIRALLGALPVQIPSWLSIGLNARVLVFVLAISLVTAMLLALISARQALRAAPTDTLRETATTTSAGERKLLGALVGVEVALSLVLSIGAGLMLNSFLKATRADLGFDPAQRLLLDFKPAGASTAERRDQLEALLERFRALPGITAAAYVSHPPLTRSASSTTVSLAGQSTAEFELNPLALHKAVSQGYFKALGIPLVKGEDLSPSADAVAALFASEATVINRKLADRLWPNEDPLGRRIKLGPPSSEATWVFVQGVVDDTFDFGPNKQAWPTLYLSYQSYPVETVTFTVRTVGEPVSALAALRSAAAQAAPYQALFNVRSLPAAVADSLWQWRLFTQLFWTFAAVALVLTSGGMYGVIAYSVSRRTQEIGIRMAMGANRKSILWSVLRHAALLAGAGLAAGLPLTVGMTFAMRSLLYQVSPVDPPTFLGVALLLLLVALVASYLPARRATRVDPLEAIRRG